ncbi:TerB family tellurite resistance protein [uncultured Thiodictyon sp.]|uniref:tellurite resistance TerB family protein n=1 Tax=uncultured Thiodictyon sp. TaxID=1846217 RepID=UPI0025EA4021|nr:TerB family tellurite resistance protein [uncultured Thiodictyon sp.]
MADWQKRGESVVNSGIDFVSGIGHAFKNLGGAIKRGKYANFIETFCAIAGDVASQDGRFEPSETEGFKRFLLDHHDNPVIAAFPVDDLLGKFKQYAIAAFLCDEEKLVKAIHGVEAGSDEARTVIIGALAIAYADGNCDAAESACIAQYARKLDVDLAQLAHELNLSLPTSSAAALPHIASVQPLSPEVISPRREPPQPLCKKCWAFLVAGQSNCDCGRDLTHDYAVK